MMNLILSISNETARSIKVTFLPSFEEMDSVLLLKEMMKSVLEKYPGTMIMRFSDPNRFSLKYQNAKLNVRFSDRNFYWQGCR